MKLFYLISLFFSAQLMAHEPNTAYFQIEALDSTIQVRAELPWTIRHALENFQPDLKESNSSANYEQAFLAYIKSHLVITGHSGKPMDLINYVELDNKGHSHQNDFLFHFKGSTISSVTNSILFDVYNSQKNYHYFNSTPEGIRYVTMPGEESFSYNAATDNTLLWPIPLSIIILLTFGLLGYHQGKAGNE